MQKTILILTFLLVCTLSNGQSKAVVKSAQGMTKEMINVLNLNQHQEVKIYEVHLEKLQKLDENKANKSLTNEEHKEVKKEIHGDSSQQFVAIIGKSKWNNWVAYNKQKRESKKISSLNDF